MMRLKLTVDVPTSADQEELVTQLLKGAVEGAGVTITTATGYTVDVVLTDVERVAAVSLVQEVTS